MLRKKILTLVALTCLASSVLYASDGCDPSFIQKYNDCLRLVDSLRPDKSGQMRVIASDGSEFTAGQARWMQGQLLLVDQACGRGDQATAARLLSAVQQLLKTHQRNS
jgi:hypothetical protein